jgi:hypothetical protein
MAPYASSGVPTVSPPRTLKLVLTSKKANAEDAHRMPLEQRIDERRDRRGGQQQSTEHHHHDENG